MKKKRRFLTLVENMIVMFLIALITGVIAYNYTGALEEGKAFKTRASIEKIETILNLAVAQEPSRLDDITSKWKVYIEDSSLIKDPKTLSLDGWGGPFEVIVEDGKIYVSSKNLENYDASKGKK